MELKRLVRELDVGSAEELADLPPDAPRHIVSATLRDDSGLGARDWQVANSRRRHPSDHN